MVTKEEFEVEAMNPGSPAAAQSGCTCARIDNHHGKGVEQNGRTTFKCSGDCPLHGFEATGQLDEQGNLLPEECI